MRFLIVLLLSACAVNPPPGYPVLRQANLGKNGCGPCAWVNSLTAAGNTRLLAALKGETSEAKAGSFIAEFGTLASEPYRGRRNAYSEMVRAGLHRGPVYRACGSRVGTVHADRIHGIA
jgi:hypothetical protein